MDRVKRRVADRFAGVIRREISAVSPVSQEEFRSAIESLSARLDWAENELRRMGPHVGAQGERIGVLEQGYRPLVGAQTQAAAVEHARARARGALVGEYEERLNSLEAVVSQLQGADG